MRLQVTETAHATVTVLSSSACGEQAWGLGWAGTPCDCRVLLFWLFKNMNILPWLVWLSGLSAGLRTKGLPVRFPVRAHAWVVGQLLSRRCVRGNHTLRFLSSLPSLTLKISKKNVLKKKNECFEDVQRSRDWKGCDSTKLTCCKWKWKLVLPGVVCKDGSCHRLPPTL